MEELSLENILTEDQIKDFFVEDHKEESPIKENSTEQKQEQEEITTEVNPEDLFKEEPESVGSESDIKEKEDTDSKQSNASPNFYSSMAKALVEDGIFQTLNKESISSIETAEDFADAISKEVQSLLDDRQRRVSEALSLGIEPTEIQKYERFINVLDSITDDKLRNEDDEGENLRKNLIYQDYINRGFSKDRALREVEKSFKDGSDIDDAKEALQSNKEFYNKQYKFLLEDAKRQNQEEQKRIKEQSEELRNSILNSDKVFGDIDLDKNTKQRIYDSITRPVYTDPNSGERLTAIQKYESENRTEFLRNIGLFYVLTDGFKSIDNLVKGKVKKEMKKGLRELERTISNTSRTSNGNLNFASGVDSNSRSTSWDIDI